MCLPYLGLFDACTRRVVGWYNPHRRHVHSVAGLAHANYRLPDFDYPDLFKLSDLVTRSHAEKTKLFRRMTFNIVSGNRDDHTKNFAFRKSRKPSPVGQMGAHYCISVARGDIAPDPLP